MMKNLVLTLLLVALSLVLMSFLGLRKNVSKRPEFAHLIDMEMEAKEDLIVFRWGDNSSTRVLPFGYLGGTPRTMEEYESGDYLPVPNGDRILGIVTKGTHLKVTRVTEKKHRMLGKTRDIWAIALSGPCKDLEASLYSLSEGRVIGSGPLVLKEEYLAVVNKPRPEPKSYPYEKPSPYIQALSAEGKRFQEKMKQWNEEQKQ